ncbi:GTP pyrophosphokinase family protein, partial [Bacillus subtilis]|nr:GTP pyrophosphokinase family protein [Bacillus subtilis]
MQQTGTSSTWTADKVPLKEMTNMDLSVTHMDDLKTVMEDWKNELLVYKFALD